jgi:hypothetical protein
MFFKSVRFRIVLWYMALLTITLLVFSALLYQNFKNRLYDDLDDLLSSKADGISNAVLTYWDIKKMEAADEGGPVRSSRAPDAGSFLAMASIWVVEKSKDPNLMSIYVQILDASGGILVGSKGIPRIKRLPKEDLESVLEGEDAFDTLGAESLAGKPIMLRVYTKPIMQDGRVKYIVQVASPQGLLYVALNGLKILLFVLLPLTVIVTGIAGSFLARVTLKPVDI